MENKGVFFRRAQVLAGTVKGLKSFLKSAPWGAGASSTREARGDGLLPLANSTETLGYVAIIPLSPKGVPGRRIV